VGGANGLAMRRPLRDGPAGSAALRLAYRAFNAREIVDRQIETIAGEWDAITDAAELSPQDRSFFKGRQFLNPYAFEGYSSPSPW